MFAETRASRVSAASQAIEVAARENARDGPTVAPASARATMSSDPRWARRSGMRRVSHKTSRASASPCDPS